MNRRWFLSATLALAGCSSPIEHNTASGRPERLFANTNPDKVRAALVTELVNRKYRISQESQSIVVGEKFTDNIGANMAFGTGLSPQATVRSSFTIIASGNDVRVVGDLAIVQNAGTGFERLIPMTNSASSLDMQSALNGIVI
jgi:hypothetical protein